VPSSIFVKGVSTFVLFAFTALTLQPLSAIAQQKPQPKKTAPSKDTLYSDALEDIKESLLSAESKHKSGKRADDEVVRIRNKKKDLDALDADVEAEFLKTEQHLKDKKLPAEILARHQAAVTDFKSKRMEFKQKLKAVEDADDQKNERKRKLAITDLAAFMKKHQKGKTHTPTDPNKLPFRSPDSKVRAPKENVSDLRAAIYGELPVQLAGPVPQGLTWLGTDFASGKDADVQSLIDTVSDDPDQYDYDNYEFLQVAVDPPSAADLAETEDIVLTPAIKAKATELNNNPVKIYNWVRNNIEFIPSYGSIQGADLTLQTKRGNAMDTASLLIGLLRAANIPARYVYGTVQIPSNPVMNWVGGVTKIEAAQSLLGQGGIPNVGLASGGQIKAIKLEHVWVEAYVDYGPSRGAINKKAGSWTPLDASFKQYQYTEGMNLQQAVPFNAQSFIDQIKQGATINEQEGWVQNINQAQIQTTLTNYQNQIKSYVDTAKPDATVGDVLGTKQIIQENRPILLGTLPYKRIITSTKFNTVPDSLRWKYRTNIYADALTFATDGAPMAQLSQSTVKLAGKKITLSFTPAGQGDSDLIDSYLPQPHVDGTPIQPSELPTSLPGYLINLKTELRVAGQVVSQSTSNSKMGTELLQDTAIFNPASQTWESGEANKPIAGEYHAIALDLQGVGQAQLQNHKAKLEQTKAKLEQFQANPNNIAVVERLTTEDLAGDLLYSGILSYFANVDANNQVSAKANQQIVAYRLPSYGVFSATAQPNYWFGIPRTVSFPGVNMDVDRIFDHVEAKDADKQKRIAFVRQIGSGASAFEHAVPERLFADQSKPANDPSQPQGVSAVKALAIAASQGQKIYTFNQNNQSIHASILATLQMVAEGKQEISSALAAGKEVTIHLNKITVNGWSGSGYLIIDPETGAGTYKIGSGANGGILSFFADNGSSIAKGIAGTMGTILFFALKAGNPILLLWTILTVVVAVTVAIQDAIITLDSGGPCSAALADLGLKVGLAFALAGLFISSKTAEGFALKLLSTMYGGDLFKSVSGSKACQ
jgi:Transglutaminase-like superfamily